jgi:3-oxoacyl-[acyl-carrier protein] reductase
MSLKDKIIILTGGGRGIGQCVALKCAKEGATIVLLSRTMSELQNSLNYIQPFSPTSIANKVDVSVPAELSNCYHELRERFSRIDVLINNAGVQAPIGLFHQNDFNLWTKNIEINLFGTANLCHLVLPQMILQGKGKIINMSGGGATGTRPNFSAYAVAKTAVVRLTENLADEYRSFNIDVNAVSPGAVNTKMLDEVIASNDLAGKEFSEALKRQSSGGTDPSIAASLIAFLASDASDGITGKLISAPWDPWENDQFCENLRNDKDLATLRRIDNKYYFKKS